VTTSETASDAAKSRWSRRRIVAVNLAFATLVGLLNFGIVRTSDLASHSDQPARLPLVWELTGAYTGLLLLPFLVFMAWRFPIGRATFARRVPLHLAAIVLYGVTHTLLMWGSRNLVYGLLGWGRYDYGDMRYRFLMEGQKQVVIYALVYAIVRVVLYARRSRERELAASRLEKELTEARLDALKTQLQPHFLFNTLNMISTFVYEDPKTADAMLGHLSDFLRLTLRHSGVQEVALATELEFTGAYLAIMKARFEERLAVEVDATDEARAARVPHLLLQPLVENAVTHATSAHDRGGRVRIAARRCGERLAVVVEDDGPGLSGDPQGALSRGIGLSNTARRLAHLYGDAHTLSLVNREEGGLSVRVELPYRAEA
jgi:hypothetical protein